MMPMNSPFYRNGTQWGFPSPLPNNYKRPSKVVSIPVHFVGSGSNSDSERTGSHSSAIKIQKVARGFLVRRSMNRIAAIRNEVEQIERRVSAPETVELMRRDAKERLRVSETLMNLLLRLDSVRALHSGVRDCRKSVINRAIALQELLDNITVNVSVEASVADSQGIKMEEAPTTQSLPNHEEAPDAVEDEDVNSNSLPMPVSVADSEGGKMKELEHTLSSASMENEGKMELEIEAKEDGDGDGEESVGTCLVEENGENNDVGKVECEEQERGVGEGECNGEGREERDIGNRELLKRMIEDNERMMGLMARLFERNEMQTRLLSSLSHRVEQLERAFACEKLRKKKKRRNTDAGHKQSDSRSCI